MGWPELLNLSDFGTREGVRVALAESYPDEGERTIANWMGQVWLFREQMAVGDYVVMPMKTGLGHVAIGSVCGDYEYRGTEPEGFRHVRAVHWLQTDIPRESFRPDLRASINANPTVYALIPNDAARRVAHLAVHGTDPGLEAAAEINTPQELPTIAWSQIGAQQRMTTTGQRGEAPSVSVSDSQGVLGAGIQLNHWEQRPKLDPATMRDLATHVAVSRLKSLSHDELVDFLLKASRDDVCYEYFEEFLYVELTKLMTALADISRRKATELISAVGTNLIDQLPEAAEAISDEASRLGLGDHVGPLDRYGAGYARKYKNGQIFWSVELGMRTTVGEIDDCMQDGLQWGFPNGDQETTQPSRFGTEGIRQSFEKGTVYSSPNGTFIVGDEKCYQDEGGSGGWLGFPIWEVQEPPSYPCFQDFEGGSIYSHIGQELKVFAVSREISLWISEAPAGHSWLPISGQANVESSFGSQGMVQRFVCFPDVIERSCGTMRPPYETAVYWDGRNKPVMIEPQIWEYYTNLGAETSWLGFPTGSKLPTPNPTVGGHFFEGGAIYWRPGNGPFGVPVAFRNFVTEKHVPIGWPVTENLVIAGGESDCIQFFEKGVVTRRDGKYEVWMHVNSESNDFGKPRFRVTTLLDEPMWHWPNSATD
jgi:hypothetical protein